MKFTIDGSELGGAAIERKSTRHAYIYEIRAAGFRSVSYPKSYHTAIAIHSYHDAISARYSHRRL